MNDSRTVGSLPGMESMAARIKYVREKAGMTQAEFAEAISAARSGARITRGAVGNWELGGGVDTENIAAIAVRFGVPMTWLVKGDPEQPPPHVQQPAPAWGNARVGGPIMATETIPLYGQSSGGQNGSFPFNGEEAMRIAAPPLLTGVNGAYAAYVVGDSMSPWAESGEVVYVNPRQPPRRGDKVVVQIAHDRPGEPPLAFVKELAGPWPAGKMLRLRQLNPGKIIEYPANRVVSVHRIVMRGDG